MPLAVIVAKAQELTEKRTLSVNCFGLPLTVTLGSDGKPRAFIRVCPHRWIVMRRVPRSQDCLLCTKDGVTFGVDSGAVRNTKGHRVPHGLHPTNVEIADGKVVLHLDSSDFSFFAYAMARRFGRKVSYPFKLKFR